MNQTPSNPAEFYQRLLQTIAEEDVHAAAKYLSGHVWRENKTSLEAIIVALYGRVNQTAERKTRHVLETLVTKYRVPVCSESGKAGRWLAATDEERDAAAAELEARAESTRERAKALRLAAVPAKPIPPRGGPAQATLWG